MSDLTTRSEQQPMTSKLLRGAIWIAIGALIAAALVCVVWVLIGDQDGIIGRAFLTILLLALFAGIAIAESHLAERRPEWLALASMITWIVALLVGAVKIWMPEGDDRFGWMTERFFQFLLVIGVMQLALVHVRLFLKASQRYVTTFTRVIVIVTFTMLGGLVAMLIFYLTFPDLFVYRDLYWRIVIALAILTAVGTTLIPLLNALFAPRPRTPRTFERPPAVTAIETGQAVRAWPTYSDGRTPLPVLPDGSPDWNAYYTGRPTYDPQTYAQSFPILDATASAPAQPSAPLAQPVPTPEQPPAPEQPSAPPVQPSAPPVQPPAPEPHSTPAQPPAPEAPANAGSEQPGVQAPPPPPAFPGTSPAPGAPPAPGSQQ